MTRNDIAAIVSALLMMVASVLIAIAHQPSPELPACVQTHPERVWCQSAFVPPKE